MPSNIDLPASVALGGSGVGMLVIDQDDDISTSGGIDQDHLDDATQEQETTDEKEVTDNEDPNRSGDDEATEDVKDDEPEIEEDDETELLNAPRSFNESERDTFKKLPRDAQQALLRLEQSQHKHFSKRDNELQTAIRDAKTAQTQASQEKQRVAEQLQPLLDTLSKSVQDEFADIQSDADFMNLANTDPARFARLQAKIAVIQRAGAEYEQLQKDKEAEKQEAHRKAAGRSYEILIDRRPVWKNNETFTKAVKDVRSYLADTYGNEIQEFMGDTQKVLSTMIDPVSIDVAYKAMMYDQAVERAKAKANGKDVPPVVVPKAQPRKERNAKSPTQRERERLEAQPSLTTAQMARLEILKMKGN